MNRIWFVAMLLVVGCAGVRSPAGTEPRVSMTAVAGSNQQGAPGTAVPVIPAVKVLRDGEPLAGAQVVFTVVLGDGTGGGTATTDADGIAHAPQWVLGPGLGEHRMLASLADQSGVTALFSVYAVTPVELVLEGFPEKRSLASMPGTNQWWVKVLDADQQPVAGIEILWQVISGPAHIISAEGLTDAAGTAHLGNVSTSGPGMVVLEARALKVQTTPALIRWTVTR